MEEIVNIEIAEFSAYPAGRDATDGPFHGEKYRKEFLLPKYQEAVKRNALLVVSLNGVMSFGSSFLEEAFGGLIRKEKVDKNDLRKRLKIVLGRPGDIRYKDAINRYIE